MLHFNLTRTPPPDDLEVIHEFSQNLKASPARPDSNRGPNGKLVKFPNTAGNGLGNRNPLGTNGQPVGSVLHIAPCENLSISTQQSSPDRKPGIGGIGLCCGLAG